MSKHTKSNKTNTILKVLSAIVVGSGLVLAGVVGTMMLTSPDKEPVSNFHDNAASSSVVQSSSTTEESSKVQLQGPDVTTRTSTQQATTQSSTNNYDTTMPSHGKYRNVYEDDICIVWNSPEGISYVQPLNGATLSQCNVNEMATILSFLGVTDMGKIDDSKYSSMVTGLSADITKPAKYSVMPVYIYIENAPAVYTLAK